MANFRDSAALGREIGRLLKEAGYSQKDLAVRLGIHESSVSRLLNGQRNLGADELFVIAEMVGAAPEAIALEDAAEPALLRATAAGDEDVARCLGAFELAIDDYFAAKALARFL